MTEIKMNDTFIKACHLEKTSYKPVWFMRQAGRYQSSYRQLKDKYDFLTLCMQPELCVEVTLMPVKQLGVDAAIFFSDIMVPIGALGCKYDIHDKKGPVIEKPIRTIDDVKAMDTTTFLDRLPFISESIKILKHELSIPLIGFCGAPFTLASYLIEGGSSKNLEKTKTFMYSNPQLWEALMITLSDSMASYLAFQIEHGVDAVQIFDSWIGFLSKSDYETYVLPHMTTMINKVKQSKVPVIYFAALTSHLLNLIKGLNCDVVSVDWRMDLQDAWKMIGYDKAIQGNLDPVVLLSPWEAVKRETDKILKQCPGGGHIFNLGHGVLQQTDEHLVKKLVDYIHEKSEAHNDSD